MLDGTPLLPSAVFVEPGGRLVTGREAWHGGRVSPQRCEPNPKQRIDDGTVLLGDREVPVVDLVTAVLTRVREEVTRAAGGQPDSVVVTHPASWGQQRRALLSTAAVQAGLPTHRLVPEPVAAAGYFVEVLGSSLPVGACLVVYDLGAGTFDVAVVRRETTGYRVLADRGLPDTGGLDVDAAIVAHLGAVFAGRQPEQWRRLTEPATTTDRRARWLMWEDVRAAKEVLSRAAQAVIPVPLLDQDAPLGREQLEQLARPLLDRTVDATRAAVRAAGLTPADLHGILLVGGASRIPLVSTLLLRAFGVVPTAIEQPELVVAEGAVVSAAQTPEVAPVFPAVAARQAGTPAPPDTGSNVRPGAGTNVRHDAGTNVRPDAGTSMRPGAGPAPLSVATAVLSPGDAPARPAPVVVSGRRTGPVRVLATLFAVVAVAILAYVPFSTGVGGSRPEDATMTLNGAPLSEDLVLDLGQPMVLEGALGDETDSQVTRVEVEYQYLGFWTSETVQAPAFTQAGRWVAEVSPPSGLAGLVGGALELSIRLYDVNEELLPFGSSPQYVQVALPLWNAPWLGALLTLAAGGLVLAVLVVRGRQVPPVWAGVATAALTVLMWTFVLFVINLSGKPEEVFGVLGIATVEGAAVGLALWRAWQGRGGPVPLAAAIGVPVAAAWWLAVNCLNRTDSHIGQLVELAFLGALAGAAVMITRTGRTATHRAA
ncbi:hypothetical protein GCM10027290_52110 [Micromonospora sonneratiae]